MCRPWSQSSRVGAAPPFKNTPNYIDNLASQNLTLFSKKFGEKIMDFKIAEEVARIAVSAMAKRDKKIKLWRTVAIFAMVLLGVAVCFILKMK